MYRQMQEYYVSGSAYDKQSAFWKSRNWLNPFEIYVYSPNKGISVRKGIITQTYSIIPTTTTSPKIYRCIWQRLLGFCDVSFQNNYTGGQFGEDVLKNVRFRSARNLLQMLQG